MRRPDSIGRAYQLVCNGFNFTGLITDVRVLEMVLAAARFKGAHYVFEANQRLPKFFIDLFSKKNGVVTKVGDVSHPNAIEVITCYPDWAERNERILKEIKSLLYTSPLNVDCLRELEYVS